MDDPRQEAAARDKQERLDINKLKRGALLGGMVEQNFCSSTLIPAC